MDLCIIGNEVEYKEDVILRPYLTSINFTVFQKYLSLNEYNDPTLRSMMPSETCQLTNSSAPISKEKKQKIKIR